MATGIPFNKQNLIMGGPGCYDLHVWQGRETDGSLQIVSCWQFTPEEIEYIAQHGHCFLRVVGGQPPTQIFAAPFREEPVHADEIQRVLAAIPPHGFFILDQNGAARRVMQYETLIYPHGGFNFAAYHLVKTDSGGICWQLGVMLEDRNVYDVYFSRLDPETEQSYIQIPIESNSSQNQ